VWSYLDESAVTAMRGANDELSPESVKEIYETFCQQREASIVAEVRKMCGVAVAPEQGKKSGSGCGLDPV
jgi:hypothetical protein